MPQRGDASRWTRHGKWLNIGDRVALEISVLRVDRIPLLVFVSSTLLMAGMALEIPAGPTGLASICRSGADGAATRSASLSTMPEPERPATTRSPP